MPELIEMDEELRMALLHRLQPIFDDYDFLFMDLGAGINPTVLSFAMMSKIRLMIVHAGTYFIDGQLCPD